MARYAKPCLDAEAYDAFVALRDELTALGLELLSGEYGVGQLIIQTDSAPSQDVLDRLSLTEVT